MTTPLPQRISLLLFLILLWGSSTKTSAQDQNNSGLYSSTALLKDFEILKGVLFNYHPGLYRYQDSITIAGHFQKLENELRHDQTLAEAYLHFSELTAKLKCGHTFCSFYNQPKSVKDTLFHLNDKLPCTFYFIDKRMFIDKNLSGNSQLESGTEITAINDIPTEKLIDTLLQYIKGDGNNNGKRLLDLHVTGTGQYEAFDIFHSLLYPPTNNTYTLNIKDIKQQQAFNVTVNTISRKERLTIIENQFGKQAQKIEDQWTYKVLAKGTGYLKIESFVTYNSDFDWKIFLNQRFKEMAEQKIENLILDIRGNEGGSDEVIFYLGELLAKKEIEFPRYQERVSYIKVKEEHRSYLNTWDNEFYDRTGTVTATPFGYYTLKRSEKATRIKTNPKAFNGTTYLLVDAANSSATFFLTAILQRNKLATVIGTPTGGNLKGTNGGQIFFLRLPNTQIEIDIPLIGYYPYGEQPDQGLQPDILIQQSYADKTENRDPVLQKALQLIQTGSTTR